MVKRGAARSAQPDLIQTTPSLAKNSHLVLQSPVEPPGLSWKAFLTICHVMDACHASTGAGDTVSHQLKAEGAHRF